MKQFYNILKILAALIIIITVTLFTASFLLQDKVAGMILKSLNNEVQTKFEFRSARLSFLRKFPKASLYLKNVYVHSSQSFDAASFRQVNTDTLLFAKSVIAQFDIKDIIKGIYNIDRINVNDGCLNIFTDSMGKVNYEISADTSTAPGKIFKINLEKINVSNLTATYNNLATKLIIRSTVNNGLIKSKISGNNIDFKADGNMIITFFRLYNFSIMKSISAGINVDLHSSDKGIVFRKSIMSFDNYNFSLSGSISDNNILDLEINGNNIGISGIKNYLPVNYRDKISAYDLSGILNIKSKITGLVTRTSNPEIKAYFNLEKGHISYHNSSLNIKDLSFTGFFTNGPAKSPGMSSVSITNFRGMLGTSLYSGSFSLSDFNSPEGALTLSGKLIPAELKDFFNLNFISEASGAIDFNLKMNGKLPHKKDFSITDLIDLNTVADLSFNSFGINLRRGKLKVNNVTGKLFVSDTVVAKNLKFNYMDQFFSTTGTFIHLIPWLAGKPQNLYASVSLSCSSLIPEILFPRITAKDTLSSNRRAYLFPRNVFLDLDFKIDSFEYKTYSAEKIEGTIGYRPGIMNFKSLKLNTFDGVISGNGFLVRNNDKSYIGRGSFILEKVDVNKAFTAFHNFGQDFIKAGNLSGKLSGTVSVLIPSDSLFKPNVKSINAEGKFLIENGGLIDFGPVERLSSYIDISELKDIHFKQLENDFFIRNNFLYLPKMDVKSTAANLIVSGKHSFDNNYEYHIKILLSDILSRKIKKPKPNTTEFGAIQDDGLGHTSMLLKIDNKGVSYDVRAAGTLLKNDIKTERKTLKTILNQEYGMFRNDTTINQMPTGTSPRVKVLWGDSDTVKTEQEPAPPKKEKKENLIKNPFRKK